MERILVALEPGRTSIWTVVHGLNLARRIHARVFILVITPVPDAAAVEKRLRDDFKEETEALIEKARSEGVPVDLYMAFGMYDEEVIKFIKDHRITLLVVGNPLRGREARSGFIDLVERIKRRVGCRIEIVDKKRGQNNKEKE